MNKINGPIIIGGIGGSGTRVIAQILRELNCFIGNDLNESLDNLSYTLLFKRKKWYYKNEDSKNKIFTGLSVLEKSMLNNHPEFSIKEYFFLFTAMISMYWRGHNKEGDGKGRWAIERKNQIVLGNNPINDYNLWGWKEPNSHLILPFLKEYFPNLKYIFTIRNGLDMAFSKNQQQLFNWGALFGIDYPKKAKEIPEASFRYWLAANKRVIQIGETMGNDRFHIVNFDKLSNLDYDEIRSFLSFLNIDIEENKIYKIESIIKRPETIGRYNNYAIDWFKEEDELELMNLGFNLK